MNAPSNTKFFPLKIQERLSGRRVNKAIKDNLSSSVLQHVPEGSPYIQHGNGKNNKCLDGRYSSGDNCR